MPILSQNGLMENLLKDQIKSTNSHRGHGGHF